MNRAFLEYTPEIDALQHEQPSERHPLQAEADEMQAAAEMLERLDAGELDAFVVDLIDRAGLPHATPVGATLAATIRRLARRLLPHDATPAPSAGRLLGLELEGLSPEDQSLEVARHFIRFATDAARRAASATDATAPSAAARRATVAAAQSHAPGLAPASPDRPRPTGDWVRQGHRLVVLNP
jgi:hypothetical protein